MTSMQYVIFKLNNEYYGIDILQVREIGPYIQSTPLPDTPDYIQGIINFRGDIIPIINLRKKFMPSENWDFEFSRIIILNYMDKQIGLAVDEASEVLNINSEDIEPANEIIRGNNKKLIYGIGKVADRIIMLLDTSELFYEKDKSTEVH